MKRQVILIMTDTTRKDMLGCYGNEAMKTPNLDRLAERGIRYENAYTCQPVCGPARACLQSGMYATQVNCHANHHILPEGMEDALARRFNASGYKTAYVEIGRAHV